MSARGRRHWLVKSEPDVYSVHDLERDGRTRWDGVRNYQARNMLRDEMSVGDPVLFYHSNADPLCVAGVARVASPSYPDPTALDSRHPHFDPKSKAEAPTWFVVDLEHVETFAVPVPRDALADVPALADMELFRKGSRLSVQPVTAAEFKAVLALARRAAKSGKH